MAKKQFANISNAELAAKGVVALADKPNVAASYGVGGLSPAQLKLWFDNLGRLLAGKINEIQTALSESGQEYVGIDNLGETISSLGDLTASFLNGGFATIMLAYHSAADMGDKKNLATLQAIINEKARLISELTEAFNNYKTLIKSSSGAAEVGISDSYNGTGKKLSNIVSDIANGTLAAKITLQCYGFATSNKATATSKTLKEYADAIADALQGDINSGLLEKINDRYTKTQTDNFLALKVDKSTYQTDKNISDGRLDSLESRATTVEGNIGDMSKITAIGADIALAIQSLNQDIDSLQLGVKPRIIRGVVLWATPENLNAALIAELNKKVKESTGRDTPDNTDSVQVWDNQMPDAGKIYTYHYWSSAVIGDELDGWYLASIYMSPAITDIPSYVLNILSSSWSENADSNGLYYITVPPATHGMGSDMSLYIDLRRKDADGNFSSCNLFTVSAGGTVVCYTDEKFEGKLIVRVGKAYYTTNTTNIVSIEMEKVNGLEEALAAKVDKNGGEVAETVTTFPDISGTAANLASGNTLKVLFGKIKNWLGRLKALAFKDKIKNADVDSAAAIEYAKLSGVAPESHSHDDRYYTESEINTKLNAKQDTLSWDDTPTSGSSKPVKSGGVYTELNKKVTASGGEIGDTKVTFSDATGTRSNISSGDTTKSLFGKIKQWFAALGTLAFKSSITNSDVSSSAAIDKSKISGLGSLAAKSTISNADVASDAAIDKSKISGLGSLAAKSSITNSDIASNAAISTSKISGLGSLATKSSVGTSDFASGATAPVAIKALYASDDTSKGTIETRLTNLGFKSGAAGITQTNCTISTNSLQKMGKWCIFNFEMSKSQNGNYTIAITIPEGFRPKDTTQIILLEPGSSLGAQYCRVFANGKITNFNSTTAFKPGYASSYVFHNVWWKLE